VTDSHGGDAYSNGVRGDIFHDVVDASRCPSENDDGQRCQLYRHDDGAHAHAQIVTRKPWRTRTHWWNDERAWTVEGPPPGQMRWAAFQVD
jgi:hypothetical protein